MIVVMGAAGNVGAKVAERLLAEGRPVRVLEHRRSLEELGRRGAEVVTGDLADPASLGVLLKDAEAALVLLPDVVTDPAFTATRARMSRVTADAIAGSGVTHVVALSTVAAGDPDPTGPAAGLRDLEQRLAGLRDRNVLLLRSPFHMENLLAAIPLIQAQRINGSAIYPGLELPMIATRDVAREAAERLLRRDFTGHRVTLLVGPEDISMTAATRALGERLGLPDLPYVQFPPDGVRGALLGAGMSEEAASQMVELQLGLNRAGPFHAVRRAADATAPTRLEEFLGTVLR
jgi:uncharacterized protein YbjT (DUF2867 family)